MGAIAVSGAGRAWGHRPLPRKAGSSGSFGCLRIVIAAVAATLFLAACAPEYDWRDVRGPGGDYWVQLPARPVILTRRIHLESHEVQMTMQGAKVRDNAFTVALVPLPAPDAEAAGMTPERLLAAMREQMLRNIGASPSTPTRAVAVGLVDAEGRKAGQTQLQAVSARGAGRHADMQLHGRFGLWQGHALQIVGVGPELDPQQTEHFLDSLRLVKR
jgi:hypothetical protein